MKRRVLPWLLLMLTLILLPSLLVSCGESAQGTTSVETTAGGTAADPESSGTVTSTAGSTDAPATTAAPPATDTSVGETSTTEPPETTPAPSEEGVDLVLFIGQSNMAGRGVASEATKVPEGHAYEFRAISDPTKLYPLVEPFGVNENNTASGVNENKKTGSMVSAFCESYYQATGTPIVAVSCAKGGEKISFFDTNTKVYADAISRVKAAKDYLQGEFEKGTRL